MNFSSYEIFLALVYTDVKDKHETHGGWKSEFSDLLYVHSFQYTQATWVLFFNLL